MSIAKKDQIIKVIPHLCKGCGICVEYCPKKVLLMNGDKVEIDDIEKCIKCGLCELRCPDYAIFLGGNKDEK